MTLRELFKNDPLRGKFGVRWFERKPGSLNELEWDAMCAAIRDRKIHIDAYIEWRRRDGIESEIQKRFWGSILTGGTNGKHDNATFRSNKNGRINEATGVRNTKTSDRT